MLNIIYIKFYNNIYHIINFYKFTKFNLITYHICSFIFLPSNSMVLILKSIPESMKQI